MTGLLHLDASVRREGSVSREMSAAFAATWRAANPDAPYTYRDLGADPVPHLDEATVAASVTPEPEHTDALRAGWAISKPLIDELLAADTVLLGVPMYNFSIPSTLKAWLDRVIVPATQLDQETGTGPLADKRTIVVTSRGGMYGPGSPRADFEYQERYLRAALNLVGMDRDLTFVNTEFTLAKVKPALFAFQDMAVESRRAAHRAVRELAVVGGAVPVDPAVLVGTGHAD